MKILLTAINAKYIHSNLAVYSLRAAANEYKEHIEIAEFTINNAKDYILQELYKQHPDVLCCSCYIWNMEYVEDIIREFHKLCPTVPIWLGGPEVSYEVCSFMNAHSEVTGIIVGEGEATFLDLCSYYCDAHTKKELKDIAGIVYREEDKIIQNQLREVIDMSTIPFSYNRMEDFSNRIIYYESSRGCPFSCSYCLSSVDKSLRFRDLKLVKEELQFFIEQKVPQVKFVDRTFNCNHNHAMEIWRFIKENDNGVTNFHFEISADLLNEEELNIISDMRPGLIQLEIGVQSTNEATILEIHRTMRLERLKEVVQTIQKYSNIHQHLDLIAGLPYEDYLTFQKSFDEIYELKPNQLQLGFLKVLKGSYMYQHAEEYGMIYHAGPPYEILKTKWLSYDELLSIKRVEEMLEVYYNSGQYQITIRLLESLFDSAFLMYLKLGEFYEKNGYFGMSHSRIRRCEILLEFLKVCLGMERDCIEMFEEALTFDLYYRENCKSRPSWAVDAATFKQQTRTYCTNGKMSHIEPFHYNFLAQGVPRREEDRIWALFHYDKRDPLDHQAMVELIAEEV